MYWDKPVIADELRGYSMYGIGDLKSEFVVSDTYVECPVKECNTVVVRRRRGDEALRSDKFACQPCGIFISPTTFEYKNEEDNLLWAADEDVALLAALKKGKAEVNRLARERSEDAVSWNVFRYFHRTGRTGNMLGHLNPDIKTTGAETIYWSFSQVHNAPWQPLLDARVEFGESPDTASAATGKRVSEPDIILLTDTHLIFVEAKFGSDNKTSGDSRKVEKRVHNPKRYLTGKDRWYESVFESDYEAVVRDQKYELMRFWLLGSAIANQLGLSFVLANLVRKESERGIEGDFGKHIRQSKDRRFIRWTWESLGRFLTTVGDEESEQLYRYLAEKTLGFTNFKDNLCRPVKAFNLT